MQQGLNRIFSAGRRVFIWKFFCAVCRTSNSRKMRRRFLILTYLGIETRITTYLQTFFFIEASIYHFLVRERQ